VRRVENREVVTVRGSSLPICDLGKLLGLPEPLEDRRRRFIVVAALGNRRLGLVVDHLYGQEDIVIKPLGSSLSRVRGFAGATELGDQRVGLVLDSGAVIEEVLSGAEGPRERLSLMHG
jgi:two-component system chemotaxis sensor kinase CheA